MKWAAPICLALVGGMLIGVTLAKPKHDPYAGVVGLEILTPTPFDDVKFLNWPEVR